MSNKGYRENYKNVLFLYALPESSIVDGIDFPYIAGINGVLVFLLCFPLIICCRKERTTRTNLLERNRLAWFCVGFFASILAFLILFVSIYTPHLIGIESPIPHFGVYSALVLSAIGTLLLFYSSKFNTIKRPNFMRWIVFPFEPLAKVISRFITVSTPST